MTEIIKGKEVAESIYIRLKEKKARLAEKGIEPVLALFQVGNKPEDEAYKKSIVKAGEKAGVEIKELNFPENCNNEDILSMINIVNGSDRIHGILMFRPLPESLDERQIIQSIDPAKDMDGATERSMLSLYSGTGEGFPPCTAKAVMEVIKTRIPDITGKKALVIGRSDVIGKPVAMMLLRENASVTICHSKTADLEAAVENADMVIAAAGKAELVKGRFREGQIVVDVGINQTDEGMKGDVDFAAADGKVKYLTPVPGGVGSVTSAVLMDHVMMSAEKHGVPEEKEFEPDAIDLATPGFF